MTRIAFNPFSIVEWEALPRLKPGQEMRWETSSVGMGYALVATGPVIMGWVVDGKPIVATRVSNDWEPSHQ